MGNLISEVVHNQDIAKVQDDNYVFIRRSMDVKERDRMRRGQNEKSFVGSEVFLNVDKVKVNVDYDEKTKLRKKIEKRTIG